ncbi:MAG TPA: EAL domain-containing protein [Solirubrobacterales bacterium]|nr:EAL domain-containing protein [Solirubrobacterales bacterium]
MATLFRLRRALKQGLGVCVLGLATIWSWLFLDLDLAALSFVAAGLIVATTYLGVGPRGERKPSGRLVVILSLLSIVLAVTILVYDHYSRLSLVTLLLASVTLIWAGVQLTLTQRGWRDARARARRAEAMGAVEAAGLDAAIVVAPDARVVFCNERACRLFGRSEVEMTDTPVGELLDRASGERPLEDLLVGSDPDSPRGPVELSACMRGSRLPVEVAVGPLKPGSKLRTLVVRDISERRRREEENRRLAAIIRSSDDAVLTKDLAGLIVSWNQGAERLYGYGAKEAIGRNVRDLIVPRERWEEVERVEDKVRRGEMIPFETQRVTKGGTLLDVSLRVFPIRNLAGEITAVCTVAHDISERRRRERAEARETEAQIWRRRLRRALGDGSLVFHGQPIIELKSGRVHHHELLVRMWVGGELVLPGSFLPFAEETELIRDLDLWAVERGIAVAAQLPVAINLSARSLGSRGLLGAIERRLAAADSLARNLTFEITETAAAENMEGARELVGELTKMGCGVALDDFGTGYGSFTYLRHLPVTQLKIDTEFISGLKSDAADRRVVESMVAVARNFEMITVAEGVEDRETFERLEELGVDLVQGYHVGRPRPLELEREAVHG